MSSSKLLALLLLALTGVCCWSQGARADVSLGCSAGCTSSWGNVSSSGTTTTITSMTGVTAGDNIRVWFQTGSVTLTSLTVNSSSTGVQIGGTTVNGAGVAVYPNSPSGALTIVATFSGTCSYCVIIAEDWPGGVTSSILDGQNATETTISTTSPCGNITTTGSNDQIEAVMFNTTSSALPSGYSSVTAYNGFITWTSSYKGSIGAGSYNPTYTASSTGNNVVICGGFKLAGAASPSFRSLIGVGQ